jgi:hypothetical protein
MATAPQGSKRRIHHWGGLKFEGDGLELESRTYPATLNGQQLATLGDISSLLSVLGIQQRTVLPNLPIILAFGSFNPSYPTVFSEAVDSQSFQLFPPGVFRLDVDLPLQVSGTPLGLESVSTHWKVFLLENDAVVSSFESEALNIIGSFFPNARVKGSFLVFKPADGPAPAYSLQAQMMVTNGAAVTTVYTLLPGKLSLEHSKIRTNL